MSPRSCAIVTLLVSSVVWALARDQTAVFRSATTGVRVDVLVTDHGAPVAGLTAADFDLRDNGVPQTVSVIESADVPVDAVLVLDTSGSTSGKRVADLRDASLALVGGLSTGDRAALVTFGHAVVVRSRLTPDIGAIRHALDDLTPSGQTSLLDALDTGLLVAEANAGRSLVVICTDGRDTESWLQADEVTEVAKRSNAVLYAVAAGSARRWQDLKALADVTGGGLIEIEKTSDFRAQLVHVLHEFRSRYVLSFTPTGVLAGGYHTLTVRTHRGGLIVKARPGYISGPSGGQP